MSEQGPIEPAELPESTPGPGQDARTEESPAAGGPRRLLRSRSDRVLGGVAGGLGRYFNIDPVIFRIGAVALTLAGGIGIFLYLAALLFVPSEEGDGTAPAGKPGRGRTVLAAVVLGIATLALLAQGPFGAGFFFAPLIVIGLVAAAIWWLLGGRGGAGRGAGRIFARLALGVAALAGAAVLFFASGWAAAAGGGAAIAMLVIVAGALLSVAAFPGGARWLISRRFSSRLPSGSSRRPMSS